MNIKRFVKLISFLSAVVFLTIGIISCATTNTTQAKDNRENPYAFLDTLQLEKGEIFVKDMAPEGGETYSASAFDAANNFLVLDDFFEFTKNLTLDQQIALTRVISEGRWSPPRIKQLKLSRHLCTSHRGCQ